MYLHIGTNSDLNTDYTNSIILKKRIYIYIYIPINFPMLTIHLLSSLSIPESKKYRRFARYTFKGAKAMNGVLSVGTRIL